MREGMPSLTAQRVAAARLNYERLDAPYADPEGDEALARDVAAGTTGVPDEQMGRYLRLRTAFFDRVVVSALEREVGQVVLVGAGYDGRALRYAKAGVLWWEVDHPATQADKRARLRRLGVDASRVRYVAQDLESPGLARALLASGLEPDGPALFCCEGVLAYLTRGAVTVLLAELRALVTPGTRLALSWPAPSTDPQVLARRQRLSDSVAAIGEPMPGGGDLGDPASLLGETRWRRAETSERSRAAGLVVAVPEWAPPELGAPATAGSVGRLVERTLWRARTDDLGRHLEATYGVGVRRLRQLDLGVHRVDLADRTTWLARVFPAARTLDAVEADAELLCWLAEVGYPAERPLGDHPVSEHCGQGVLVTGFAPGRPPGAGPSTAAVLGDLLGRLHTRPPACAAAERPGGAWHHLVVAGSPGDELTAARALLHDARHRVPGGESGDYDALGAELEALDPCENHPLAVVHPDFVPRNVLVSAGEPTVIDWSGAGRGPRVVSLGCLLWSLSSRRPSVEAAVSAYSAHVRLEPSELDALENAMSIRPLVLAVWSFATGRDTLDGARQRWHGHRDSIATAARLVRSWAGGG